MAQSVPGKVIISSTSASSFLGALKFDRLTMKVYSIPRFSLIQLHTKKPKAESETRENGGTQSSIYAFIVKFLSRGKVRSPYPFIPPATACKIASPPDLSYKEEDARSHGRNSISFCARPRRRLVKTVTRVDNPRLSPAKESFPPRGGWILPCRE